MVETAERTDLRELPAAPKNPLPRIQQIRAVRTFHTGIERLRDAGGYVTRVSLAPKWLMPPVVIVTSPQGAHDVLGRTGAHIEKTIVHDEVRHLLGPNLFDLTNEPWLPRRRALQPVFTKQHVRAFAGHMAQAAEGAAADWQNGIVVDVDAECRELTLRALGRSVLGLDLEERSGAVGDQLRIALAYATDRGLAPVRAPRWLPTPARRRAYAARDALHGLATDIVRLCRADPAKDAPLVQALLAATDPETGEPLTDAGIRDELVLFLLAGHDTTATTLTYALWALGQHPDMQQKVYDEVTQIPDRELTPDDVPRLEYTTKVLHETLRLCPPGAAVARVAVQDVEVDGYRVEAGTVLLVGIYAMHRDPTLWDQPLEFRPDRFERENSKNRDRWQYLPFGAGPRSCIGDHFAMLEATLALATIVRKTEIHSVTEHFPMIVPFTTVAAEPIEVRPRIRPILAR
ncbi:MAG TPA: cytochrome P450 [Mycobacterium sp.]|nr:cytochrome P450 [Mycobacterium sp.]